MKVVQQAFVIGESRTQDGPDVAACVRAIAGFESASHVAATRNATESRSANALADRSMLYKTATPPIAEAIATMEASTMLNGSIGTEAGSEGYAERLTSAQLKALEWHVKLLPSWPDLLQAPDLGHTAGRWQVVASVLEWAEPRTPDDFVAVAARAGVAGASLLPLPMLDAADAVVDNPIAVVLWAELVTGWRRTAIAPREVEAWIEEVEHRHREVELGL